MENEIYRKKLIQLLQNCSVPSDSLHFSSIVIMKDGTEFYGVNVKNAVFRDAILAEQSAIAQAVTSGYKKGDFEKLYLMVGSASVSDLKYLNRAVICEFFEEDKEVVCMNLFGQGVTLTVSNLYASIFKD